MLRNFKETYTPEELDSVPFPSEEVLRDLRNNESDLVRLRNNIKAIDDYPLSEGFQEYLKEQVSEAEKLSYFLREVLKHRNYDIPTI